MVKIEMVRGVADNDGGCICAQVILVPIVSISMFSFAVPRHHNDTLFLVHVELLAHLHGGK